MKINQFPISTHLARRKMLHKFSHNGFKKLCLEFIGNFMLFYFSYSAIVNTSRVHKHLQSPSSLIFGNSHICPS
ncbi:hypothetical protein KSS87_013093, partial [Heliosperma pusillum]